MDIHFSADPSAFAPVITLLAIVFGLAVIAAVDMAFCAWVDRERARKTCELKGKSHDTLD